jgi:hypothetical protein
LARIMGGFRRIPTCRRVRLLVVPENTHALRLYASVGFRRVGVTATGDIILQAVLPGFARRDDFSFALRRPSALAQRARRRRRPRRSPDAHAVRAIGTERGPPRTLSLS